MSPTSSSPTGDQEQRLSKSDSNEVLPSSAAVPSDTTSDKNFTSANNRSTSRAKESVTERSSKGDIRSRDNRSMKTRKVQLPSPAPKPKKRRHRVVNFAARNDVVVKSLVKSMKRCVADMFEAIVNERGLAKYEMQE